MRIKLLIFLLINAPALAGEIRSYVDQGGTRVLTNLPGPGARSTRVHMPSDFLSLPLEARRAKLQPLTERISSQQGVDPDLVEAIMQIESQFNPRAVSPKNCKGLMQLHPDTARRFGVSDIFDPEQNISGGVSYLRWLLDYFDHDLPKVVAAYNAGESAVERHGGIPPYRETRDYVRKVNTLYSLDAGHTARVPDRRIQRIETSDGRVIFTNTPWLVASRQ